MTVLTAVDLLGVQGYVFATNRLRDVVAGSEIVADATGIRSDTRLVRRCASEGQCVFGGGGNALLQFDDHEEARNFAGMYSRLLLDEAPGLQVAIAHQEVDPADPITSFLALQERLFYAKQSGFVSVPLDGYGVTEPCRETQRMATVFVREPGTGAHAAVSADVAARRRRWSRPRRVGAADGVAQELLDERPALYLPTELDEFSSDGNTIAAVHIDANGLGLRIHEALLDSAVHNVEDLVTLLRLVADEIDDAMARAARCVLATVVAAVDVDVRGKATVSSSRTRAAVGLTARDGGWNLPLRTLVLGGDDFTFTCDGRLGITLARAALVALSETRMDSLDGEPLGACAGVSIARRGTPLARMVQCAHAACRNAKQLAATHPEEPGFALDWHVGEPVTELESLRRGRVTRHGVCLTGRPYELFPIGGVGVYRSDFVYLDDHILGPASGFKTSDPAAGFFADGWQRHRSRLHDLGAAIMNDQAATTALLERLGLARNGPDWLQSGGFDDAFHVNRLPDAIELAELHVPLNRVNGSLA